MDETDFCPTIRTQADLQAVWRRLMGPWSFTGHSVWLLFVVDDAPIRQLVEITGAVDPDRDCFDRLSSAVADLAQDAAPGARVAFLRTRPGTDLVTADDRRWADRLYTAAREARVPCEVVHLGTRGAIRALPLDELGHAPDSA